MGIAALVTWVLTAVGGFVMLGMWISKGGTRQPRTSSFPPAVIFGHFGLAAVGLVLWIIYLATDSDGLAWLAFVIMLPVAALGLVMFFRWLPQYQASRTAVPAGDAAAGGTAASPESRFPVAAVAGHGVLAVVTVVLVLLAALEVGG